jgi:hypothetical protein
MNGTETEQYRIWLLAGSVWISSEMKALNDECEHFEIFPPGHLYSSNTGGFSRWYSPPWYDEAIIPSVPYNPVALRKAFEKVNKRTFSLCLHQQTELTDIRFCSIMINTYTATLFLKTESVCNLLHRKIRQDIESSLYIQRQIKNFFF